MTYTNVFRAMSTRLSTPLGTAFLGLASTLLAPACEVDTGDSPSEEEVGSMASAAVGTVNLARNKTATGSTPCATTEAPAKAVNGSVSGGWADKWCSGESSLYLTVDLGAATQVAQFVVKHAGAGGEDATTNTRDFTIQVSTDGVNFTTAVTVTRNTASVTTHDISTVTARYVKLAITKPTSTTDIHARVYELEVYGPATAGGGGTAGSAGTGSTAGTGGTAGTASGGTASAGTASGGTASAGSAGAGTSGAWQLVWADEFNGSGLVSSADWTYEVGRVRNNEAQYYTNADLDNARQEGGNLVITAIKEPMGNQQYTSASVTTQGRHEFLYGRIEVRAKLPGGRGSWPAIWTLGTNINQVRWPACGEIDIMEQVGFEANAVHATIHTTADQNGSHNAVVGVDQPNARFYTYALEWTEQRLDFFVDDQKVYTFNNDGGGTSSWPFSKPQYLLLNLAIGGSWGGQQGIDDTIFPARYYIDYVRYYKKP